jgi:hypothetical protein
MQALNIKERMFWGLPKMPVREPVVIFPLNSITSEFFPATPDRPTHPRNIPPVKRRQPEPFHLPDPAIRRRLFDNEDPEPMDTDK